MMNMSIACDMQTCMYNETNEHFCTLNKIKVAPNKGGAANCSGCMNYKEKK